jgi:predicted DNA-binding transcriptional regulator AlpA
MIPTSSLTGLLDETRAAHILSLSVKTLRRWRWAGKGPVFRKIGRAVRYASSDLEAFISSALRTSTSDTGEPPATTIRAATEADIHEMVQSAAAAPPLSRAIQPLNP